jgi:hypothetical protein
MSIGGEVFIASKPARWRTFENRPSAPTVSVARTSCSSVNALVANAPNGAVLLNQRLHISGRPQPELWILARFARNEFKKLRLRNEHDVRELRLEASEVKRVEVRVCGSQRWAEYFHMSELVKGLRKTYLIENFENGGMDRVSTKVTVEVLVRFKNRYPDAFPRQQQGEHHATRPAADNATGSLLRSRMCSVFFDWGAGITSVAIMILRGRNFRRGKYTLLLNTMRIS